MLIKEVYTLIKKDVPDIKGKTIITDARVGGEKLVYKRVSYPVNKIILFNKYTIMVPLLLYRKIMGGFGLDIITKEVVCFRPYKKIWTSRNKRSKKEPFNLWGKKDHPLTNMWLELEYDYEDIYKKSPLIKTRIEDQSLINFLRQHEENFYLIKTIK